jgi:UDP:flavonoid glycosyltransferase YjiC (YdhE family)
MAAAREYVAATGQTAVVLTGRQASSETGGATALRLLPRISAEEVQHVLAGAQFAVSNGGTTMVHALAHGRPLVAIPLAGDQSRRIRLAVKLGIADTAPREASAIAAAAGRLAQDAARRVGMTRRIAELRITNGVAEAVAALTALAGRR